MYLMILGDPSRHLTYRPYFHSHPSSATWIASPPTADLSSISKSTNPYSFHPAAAWMSDGGGSASVMSRSWGANSAAIPHHQQQSLHHHHHHHHHQQQQQQQQNLLQQSASHTSALFQPMVNFHHNLLMYILGQKV